MSFARALVLCAAAALIGFCTWAGWRSTRQELALVPALSELEVVEGKLADAEIDDCAYRWYGRRGRSYCAGILYLTIDTATGPRVVETGPYIDWLHDSTQEWLALRGQSVRIALGRPMYGTRIDPATYDLRVGDAHLVQHAELVRRIDRSGWFPLIFFPMIGGLLLVVIAVVRVPPELIAQAAAERTKMN